MLWLCMSFVVFNTLFWYLVGVVGDLVTLALWGWFVLDGSFLEIFRGLCFV